MALRTSSALVGFYGDDLDPAEIAARLRCAGDVEVRKGGTWRTSTGATKVAPTGSWRIRADNAVAPELEEQIQILLARLSDDLSVWQELASRFRAVVFCGLFLRTPNAGVVLSPETLSGMAQRKLILDLDIWALELEDE